MKGIVLVSHGEMAKGMINSAELFFGDNIEQLTAVSLLAGDNVEGFRNNLLSAVEQVNTGDGVIVLADLFGGTPCNIAALSLGKNTNLISGMNFTMLLEILGTRQGINPPSIQKIVETGTKGIKEVGIKNNTK